MTEAGTRAQETVPPDPLCMNTVPRKRAGFMAAPGARPALLGTPKTGARHARRAGDDEEEAERVGAAVGEGEGNFGAGRNHAGRRGGAGPDVHEERGSQALGEKLLGGGGGSCHSGRPRPAPGRLTSFGEREPTRNLFDMVERCFTKHKPGPAGRATGGGQVSAGRLGVPRSTPAG